MDLDRPEGYAEVDSVNALADVEAAASQWSGAPRLDRLDLDDVDALVVTGVGGSGICADVVSAIAADRLSIPVVVHKNYGLPAHVGPRSVVVAVSCSGDTEETISGAEEALDRGARLLAITGGGRLAAMCEHRGHAWVPVPRTCQPRHSLGALAVPVLSALGLDTDLDEVFAVQRRTVAACGRSVPTADNPVKQLGKRIGEAGIAIVQGTRPLAAVAAYRLKCQLNENAELPAFFGALPEATHNELVGWQEPNGLAKSATLVILRDPQSEHPRASRRIALFTDLVADRFASVAELTAEGDTPLARLASLLLLADLTSIYAALALDRDPTPIALIESLKQEMSRE